MSLHKNELACCIFEHDDYRAPQGSPWEGDSPDIVVTTSYGQDRGVLKARPVVLAALMQNRWLSPDQVAKIAGIAIGTATGQLRAMYGEGIAERRLDPIRGYVWRHK